MSRGLEHAHAIDIAAPPSRVWEVWMDLERWPEWTTSMRSLERLDPAPLALGHALRIHQPRVAPLVWRVTELVPGKRFTWESRSLGIHSVATHELEALPGGGARVRLSVRQTGWLAILLRGWLEGLTRRYVALEAAGLKQRCEQR